MDNRQQGLLGGPWNPDKQSFLGANETLFREFGRLRALKTNEHDCLLRIKNQAALFKNV